MNVLPIIVFAKYAYIIKLLHLLFHSHAHLPHKYAHLLWALWDPFPGALNVFSRI